jgi:hypothetical protein
MYIAEIVKFSNTYIYVIDFSEDRNILSIAAGVAQWWSITLPR